MKLELISNEVRSKNRRRLKSLKDFHMNGFIRNQRKKRPPKNFYNVLFV